VPVEGDAAPRPQTLNFGSRQPANACQRQPWLGRWFIATGRPIRKQTEFQPMQKLLVTAVISAFGLIQAPAIAQDKKTEPAKSEAKKAEPAKPEEKMDASKAEAKKDDMKDEKKTEKKKPKKGGC
jgi:hypothetical protein